MDLADILARLGERAEAGSKSERRLARLILDDPRAALRSPIAALAGRAQVSEPTVTRFCRNLGCEGTRDFKLRLAQGVAVGGVFLSPAAPGGERVPALVADAAVTAIGRVRAGIDMDAVQAIAKAVTDARHVLLIGSGGTSSMMALELQNRLFRFRINAVAHADGQMQRMAAAVSGPGTLVVAFSTSGRAPLVVDSVRVARQYGAASAAVTAPGSPLAEAAGIVLPFETKEDGNIYKPTASRYGLLAIVDILATVVAERLGPSVAEGLRRIRHGMVTLSLDDPALPLGD